MSFSLSDVEFVFRYFGMLHGVNQTFRCNVSVSSSRVEMSLQMGPTRYLETPVTDYSNAMLSVS
jgi:hypothetical protein